MEQLIPLDVRKQQILKAVVSDYTETGVPVGSHALATKYLVALSSATIRNELASLVEIGYLLQPHTSAGRIPSDQGYRYYVDFLMEEEELPAAARRQIESLFGEPPWRAANGTPGIWRCPPMRSAWSPGRRRSRRR